MIAGNFVSCYRCAGEGSDLSCSRFFGVGGGQGDDWGLGGWRCWFLSRPSGAVQAEPEPEIGSASFIFFDIFLLFFFSDLYCSHI